MKHPSASLNVNMYLEITALRSGLQSQTAALTAGTNCRPRPSATQLQLRRSFTSCGNIRSMFYVNTISGTHRLGIPTKNLAGVITMDLLPHHTARHPISGHGNLQSVDHPLETLVRTEGGLVLATAVCVVLPRRLGRTSMGYQISLGYLLARYVRPHFQAHLILISVLQYQSSGSRFYPSSHIHRHSAGTLGSPLAPRLPDVPSGYEQHGYEQHMPPYLGHAPMFHPQEPRLPFPNQLAANDMEQRSGWPLMRPETYPPVSDAVGGPEVRMADSDSSAGIHESAGASPRSR